MQFILVLLAPEVLLSQAQNRAIVVPDEPEHESLENVRKHNERPVVLPRVVLRRKSQKNLDIGVLLVDVMASNHIDGYYDRTTDYGKYYEQIA